MGGYAYNNEPCMFFVGGNDSKADTGSSGKPYGEAAGCTLDWWLNELGGLTIDDGQDYIDAAIAAMAKLMGAEGECKFSGGVIVRAYDSAGLGYVSFKDPGDAAVFTDIEEGMLVYINEHNTIMTEGDGIYKVISVDEDAYWFNAEGMRHTTISIGDAADVYIGGALDDFVELAEEIDCNDFSQQILINKDFTAIASMIDVGSWGAGDAEKNTWLCLHGFNRVPDDIVNPAGVYYQSIKDVYDDDVPANDTFVKIGNNSLASNLFDMDDAENIHFEGINFFGLDSVAYYLMTATDTSLNHIFKHCVFESPSNLSRGGFSYPNSHRIVFEDCTWIGFDVYRDVDLRNGSVFFKSCILDGITKGVSQFDNESIFVSGTLLNRGVRQLELAGTNCEAFVADSTFVNAVLYSIRITGGLGSPGFAAAIGCIFEQSQASSVPLALRNDTYPSSAYLSNCVAWSAAGQLDKVSNDEDGTSEDPIVHDVIEVDPQLTDSIPQNKTVLLGGAVDPGGVKRHLGCVGQEWQFVGRSRTANAGRMGIYK